MRVILQNHFKSLPQANDSEHLAQVPLPPSKSVGPKSRKNQRKSNATARALSQSVAMRYIEDSHLQPLDFFGSDNAPWAVGRGFWCTEIPTMIPCLTDCKH